MTLVRKVIGILIIVLGLFMMIEGGISGLFVLGYLGIIIAILVGGSVFSFGAIIYGSRNKFYKYFLIVSIILMLLSFFYFSFLKLQMMYK